MNERKSRGREVRDGEGYRNTHKVFAACCVCFYKNIYQQQSNITRGSAERGGELRCEEMRWGYPWLPVPGDRHGPRFTGTHKNSSGNCV